MVWSGLSTSRLVDQRNGVTQDLAARSFGASVEDRLPLARKAERMPSRTDRLLLSLVFFVMGLAPANGEDRFGLEKRVPWNPSRLSGSPEPSLPYTVEKTLAKHAWKSPIYIAPEPGTDRLWVVQASDDGKGSRIVRIPADPNSAESEVLLGLPRQLSYSVCFHPAYAVNGFVYVFNNGPREEPIRLNRISRYTVGRAPPRRVDAASEEVVIQWKSAGHDGGDMAFGRDGFLYITTGDGSSDSDAWNSGQTLDDLLGSVLRIDVDRRDGGRRYAIPADNPFVSRPGARPEIWAYGLRNPWRMSADPKSDQIWVGNNGQDLWETAHLIHRGENYGWSITEGSHPFYLERTRGPTPIVPPTIEHSHAEFRSLTGGVVYRGDRFPDLDGAYVYGDYSSGRIWAMKHDGQRPLWHREIADTTLQIASFRVDTKGELLITDNGGGFYRLVPAPKSVPAAPFPTRLSDSGLFTSLRENRPDPALIPYSVNAPGYNDGAEVERFLALPGESKVAFDAGRGWNFPDGTALVQNLSLERKLGEPASRVRVETRIMLRQQGEWAGYSYRWNEDQSDATLVGKNGDEVVLPTASGNGPGRKWRFPSRAECMACHSRAGGFVLGVTGSQLNRNHDYGGVRDNQLRALDHIGLFSGTLPKPPRELDKLVDPRNESADLEIRARTYLHVNCSVCHVESGGGNSMMELGLATTRDKMRLIGARPQHETFGIADAMLVAPGDPGRSVLVHRVSHRGRGQMPPLVSNRVDDQAVALLRGWIAGLKPDRAFVRAWTMNDLVPLLDRTKTGRSADQGRQLFRDTGCIQCHRIEGEGGTVGPDLNGVARRLNPKELLESIVEPSKVIAEAYAGVRIATHDGTLYSGLIEREDDRMVMLRATPPAEAVTIPKAQIADRGRSDQSNMPAGMLNVLKEEQILDLLAYLLGDPQPRSPKP
jgi:uncharacterized repeat protein (TIGR03806 family)